MKIVSVVFLILFFQFIQGCDDSFNPYTTFKQDYGVACVLRSDTTLQLATVINNYLIEDNNSVGPKLIFVEGADVRLWHGDSVYRLRDTTLLSSDNNDSIKCYYTNKFKIENNKNIEIEVLLSNGKRLKGISKTPSDINFKINSDVIIPAVGKSQIQVSWSPAAQDNFYQTRLKFKCEIIENGINKIYYKTLPKSVSIVDGVTKAIFPQPSKNPFTVYNLEAISWYLQTISDSLNNASTLSIHQSLELEVITFDSEISRYISVTNSDMDNLSIRFDQGEYTNISGGLGIFGSQIITKYSKLRFIENYIRSFNLNFIYDN